MLVEVSAQLLWEAGEVDLGKYYLLTGNSYSFAEFAWVDFVILGECVYVQFGKV